MSKDIGTLTRELFHFKQRKKALNTTLKELNGEISSTELMLLREMQNQDLWEAGNKDMKVFRSLKTVPHVVNWDQFYAYIYEHKAAYMLERRPAVTACRELFDNGEHIPGVDPYTFEEVRTRSK